MENEDKIVAGLERLHQDLEKLRASVEMNYATGLNATKRMWRGNIGVYLAVVAAFIVWSFLAYHR